MGQMTVGSLITLGYGIQRFQLVGGPSWMNSDRFDINALAEDVPLQPTPPGTPNRMQLLGEIAPQRALRARRLTTKRASFRCLTS